MRCLQCGKDLPLLKRMAGSEFCSDAHRKEYQKEYSDLALGRLLQSKPPGLENNAGLNPAPSLLTPPATNGQTRPVTPKLQPVAPKAPANTQPRVVPPVAPPVQKKKAEVRTAIPMPSAPAPAPKTQPDPAFAKAAAVDKPRPADVPLSVPRKLAIEQAFATKPGAPSHQITVAPAALLESATIAFGREVEVADVAVHAIEREVELRETARPAPRIDLNLRIAAPGVLDAQEEAVIIQPMTSIAPEAGALWIAEQLQFASSLVSLGTLAGFELATTGFEEPAMEAPETSPLAAPVAEPIAKIKNSKDVFPVPDLVVERLPVTVEGIAAGRVKPSQVFGAALFTGKIVQVPPPSGLPLRPLMVLGAVVNPAPPTTGKKSKSDVRILPPAPAKPIPPVAVAAEPISLEPDLGLPELRLASPKDTGASRMPKIVAAVAAVAALGFGIFFFVGRSESRPRPAVETSTTSANWISDFAVDAKNQRRVSVLRSSLGQATYRLDFESSIRIKGLGWVYRAQDAKNYYVSKIELEKPGQNPEFAILHYAVIDGVEQPHAQTPLHVGVPLGGHYKIRFEAAGERFTTWIQGQQVDEWMDGRLKTGGAGLYREGAEQFTLHGDFLVTALAK